MAKYKNKEIEFQVRTGIARNFFNINFQIESLNSISNIIGFEMTSPFKLCLNLGCKQFQNMNFVSLFKNYQ